MPISRPLDWVGLLKRLKDHDVEFFVIGGVAAMLRGAPVITLDVDVCCPMTEENLFRIHAAVRSLHPKFRFRPDRMPLWEDPARLRGFKNLNLETDLGVIDFLGELPGVGSYDETAPRTTLMDVGGFTCQVLALETLIEAKRAAGRGKDRITLHHLEIIRRNGTNRSQFDPHRP